MRLPAPGRLGLACIPGAISGAVAAWGVSTASWGSLGVPNPGIHFGDLRVVLTAAECAAQDPGWSIASSPCLPGMAIYNYPSLWAKALAWVGADATWASSVAILLIVIFVISIVALAYLALGTSRTWFPVAALSVAAISPPALLAFERGNIDQAVFGVLTASIVVYCLGAARSSGLLLAVATALKLFPLGAAPMLLLDRAKTRGAVVVYGIATLAGLALVVRDLPLIASRTPQLDGASFGAAELPLLAWTRLGWTTSGPGYKAVGLLLLIAGIAAVAIAIGAIARRKPTNAWSSLVGGLADDRTAASLVTAGGGAFLMAYLVGPSFDYRLIFLIPAIAGFSRIASPIGMTAAVVLLVQMLVSYSTFVGAAQYISDLMLLVVAPALLILIVQVVRRSRATGMLPD